MVWLGLEMSDGFISVPVTLELVPVFVQASREKKRKLSHVDNVEIGIIGFVKNKIFVFCRDIRYK